jgi:hypothetical protein
MTIRGLPGSKDGITNQELDNTNIQVRNGTIKEMGGNGIYFYRLQPSSARGHRIDSVAAISNAGPYGIGISDGIITGCSAHHNADTGIRAFANFSSSIVGCSASNNMYGLDVNTGSILDSTAEFNSSNGMSVGTSGVIRGCSSSANRIGFGGASYHISNSTARENWGAGIQANVAVTAVDNLIIAYAVDASTVGILVANAGSRIEGNNIVRQGTAIKITGSGNLIIGNTLMGNNTAANIVAGNRVGTLVTAPSMSAVNGNSGGGSMGTTDPNANILY